MLQIECDEGPEINNSGDDCNRPHKNRAVKRVTSDGTLDRKQVRIRRKEGWRDLADRQRAKLCSRSDRKSPHESQAVS